MEGAGQTVNSKLAHAMEKAQSPAVPLMHEFQFRIQGTLPPNQPSLLVRGNNTVTELQRTHSKEMITETLINVEKKRLEGEVLYNFTRFSFTVSLSLPLSHCGRHVSPYRFAKVQIIQDYLLRPRAGHVAPVVKLTRRAPNRAKYASVLRLNTETKLRVDTEGVQNMVMDAIRQDASFQEEVSRIVRQTVREELLKFSNECAPTRAPLTVLTK